jgi:hypothetical protein
MSVTDILAAGAMSGAFADVITHPICTVKARMMTQGATKSLAGSETYVYKSLFDGFKHIIRTEGPLATYKGLGVVLIGAAPAQALFFTGMTTVQKTFSPKSDLANFGAGFAAQICGGAAWVPMEVIKEKMMIQGNVAVKETYSGSFSMIQKVVAKEGLMGVYRGFWLQQLTYGPFNGLAVLFYNRIKFSFPKEQQDNAFVQLASSSIGYGIAAAITNPFDVVKTRRQVQASNPELFNYSSALDCARKIMKNEGATAFMDGVSGRIGWLLPRCALAMTGFEFFLRQLQEK